MSSSSSTSSSEYKCKRKVVPTKVIKGNKVYYKQNFLEKWLVRFHPWLARDVNDPHKGFCKACERCLNNKHFERHENTPKHIANLRSYLKQNGEPSIPIKKEPEQRKERKRQVKCKNETATDDSNIPNSIICGEIFDEEKSEVHSNSKSNTKTTLTSNKRKSQTSPEMEALPNDRKKLFLQVQNDKLELMSSLKAVYPKVKRKDQLDSFLDSVGSSVKALSPKLVAEAKMRISQLVYDLEQQSITDNEANKTLAAINLDMTTASLAERDCNEFVNFSSDDKNTQTSIEGIVSSLEKQERDLTWKSLISPKRHDGQLTNSSMGKTEKTYADSFCDSVCTTMKSFPMQLASELKFRISQLIFEIELQAITEIELDAAVPSTSCIAIDKETRENEIY